MLRVPHRLVDAVRVLLEGPDARGAIHGPELHGVVPRRREERVAARGVVVDGVDFTRVLLERSDRVGGRREGRVVDFDGAVSDGGHEDGVVGFGPGDVVDRVGGVEGDGLGDAGRSGGELEDVDLAVSEDSEVLSGGDGEAGLVEGAEFH